MIKTTKEIVKDFVEGKLNGTETWTQLETYEGELP